LKRFFLALRFLTIFPYGGGNADVSEEDLCVSTVYYPLAGGIVGALLSLFFVMAGKVLPALLTAVLTVTAWVIITAGLHLDGLMDTFDGLGVRGNLEKRLDVMRDSRVGAFGVLAAVLLLLLKTAALATLSPEIKWPVLFMAPVAGRTAMVALMATSRYARAGQGLAKSFVEGTGLYQLAVSFTLFALLGWLSLGGRVLIFALIQVIIFLLLRKTSQSWFGGVTGDLLGAACEIHEFTALLSAYILF